MKQILVKIDDRIYEMLQHKMAFRRSMDGCFAPAGTDAQIVDALVKKIDEGKSELELAVPGEPLM